MNKKYHILFCLHYSSMNNGAVRSLVDVIENIMVNNDIQIYIIYPDKKGSAIDYLEKLGAKTIRIPFYRNDYHANFEPKSVIQEKLKYIIKKVISPYCYMKAYRFAKNNHIDLIYTNTIVIDYGIKLSEKLKLPHIWHVREFGAEDHGLSFFGGEDKLYKKLSKSDSVIYISNAIASKYQTKVKSKKEYVIYNDISSSFINAKKEYNVEIGQILNAVIIGTIQEGKGQLEVIKAVEMVNKDQLKIVLHIAGEKKGKYYEMLENYITGHNLKNCVYFDGFITKVNEYRASMDIGVVASSNEAFGRVTVEGMLSGLAMIGANTAGTAELISNNINGLLYELGNVDELANCFERFYEDREFMKVIAEKGFYTAVEKFTTHTAAQKIIDVIRIMGCEE